MAFGMLEPLSILIPGRSRLRARHVQQVKFMSAEYFRLIFYETRARRSTPGPPCIYGIQNLSNRHVETYASRSDGGASQRLIRSDEV